MIVPLLEECFKVSLSNLILSEADQKGAACGLSSPSEKKRKQSPLKKHLEGFLTPFINAGLVSSDQRIRTVTKSFISSNHSSLTCHFQ